MRRIEKVVSIATSALVGTFGMLAVYTAHGPVSHTPIAVVIPDAVMNVACGENTVGCYLPWMPDFIWLNDYGVTHPTIIAHETLHYEHPQWSECEVSNYLFETTGAKDFYQYEGGC